MQPVPFLSAIFLLCSSQVRGSSAATDVFVLKGDDVLLKVTNDFKDIDFILWKFKKVILVRFSPGGEPKVADNYTRRVTFSVENYSVKLKNLQETDSGVYTARVTAQNEYTTEYNVTVQGPVSPVQLTVDSVSNSSDSCNVTVTCSTQDSHISSIFGCDTETCSQDGGERSQVTTSAASLSVYLVNDSIICNHSNQVNWTKSMTNIQDSCPRWADSQSSDKNIIVPVVVVIIIIIVNVIIAAVLWHRKRKRTGKQEITENTEYATFLEDPPNQSPTNNAAEPSPNSVYSFVDHPDKSPTNNAAGPSPNSVYSFVDHPDKSPTNNAAEPSPNSVYSFVDHPDKSPTNDAAGPSPNSLYSVVGPHAGSSETGGNTLPESQCSQREVPARSSNNSSGIVLGHL